MKRLFLALMLFGVLGFAFQPLHAAERRNVSSSIQTFEGRTLLEESLKSDLMARSIPYRVLLPEGYEDAAQKDRKYPVAYLLHGLTGNYKNWTDFTKLAKSRFGREFIIVMPDGENGWYSDSVSTPNGKYESYIIKELIPGVEAKYRARTDRNGRVIAGLSMGGYGAMKFGIKYPEMFVVAGSFSGALDAAKYDPSTMAGFRIAADTIRAAFGEMDNESRKANDIFGLVKRMDTEAKKKLPFLYLDCGTEDFLLKQNQDFAKQLLESKIPHEFRQLPGVHDFRFWNTQVEQFMFLAEEKTRPFVN